MSDTTASSAAPSQSQHVGDDAPFLSLHIVLPGGDVRTIEAAPGFNAMELIRAAGIPIKAECGGSGVCATCHVRVPDQWSGKLQTPLDEEHDTLDEIASADDASRLCCQIRMTDDLDGLRLELQADSIAPRHYAAAEEALHV